MLRNPKKRGTDAWGIDSRYQDALGEWHETSAGTHSAILEAMNADPEHPPAESGVLLVHPPTQVCLTQPGELTLESGEKQSVTTSLPLDLPTGYHRLRSDVDGSVSHIICGPGECYLPEELKTWGWALQLYALRSRRSWGIGDLGDLREFASWSAERKAGLILVNPLSAPAPIVPQQSSPYYPSTRRYRNPLYLRIEEIPGAADSGIDLEPLARAGRALNQKRIIDRDAVFILKMQALEAIWKRFGGSRPFEAYREREGRGLETYARFCVLAEHHGNGWRQWPREYRHPDTPCVSWYCEGKQDRVRFHQWVQWLLDEQLSRASEPLAIMQDLPIGVDPAGADAWAWQDLFADGVAVGAPPDEFNTQGQNWGLPPFIPHKLREAGYEPFIQTIRSTLQHAGGLRIDHVMGLFRLFWIPAQMSAAQGAYVRYRADEMLAILAIESQRAKAFVVGEDLGTVEEGVREMLQAHKVLSYRLVWFEKEPPVTYPEMALAAVTTHDLPTVAGLWTGSDLKEQIRLDLKPNEAGILETRERLKRMLAVEDSAPVQDVAVKTHELLATAPCRLLTAALDDALAVEERPNMPATVGEWPNWSIALPRTLEEICQEPMAGQIAGVLDRTRDNG